MANYRVREIKIIEAGNEAEQIKPLREYELVSGDEHAAIEEVRHFFEVEIVNLRTPQTIDFDALVVLDSTGVEVARFRVSDVWKREADAVNSGKRFSRWV